jgi:hypothetical protein
MILTAPHPTIKYHASIHTIMQVSTYVSANDYEILSNHKGTKTVAQLMADAIREKAKSLSEHSQTPKQGCVEQRKHGE